MMKMQKARLSLFALVLMAGTMASAATITFQSVTAAWSNPVPAVGPVINNANPTITIDWGVPVAPGTQQSGYDFTAITPAGSIEVQEVNPPIPSDWVLLGDFTHNNFGVTPPWLTSVNLGLNVDLSVDGVNQGTLMFTYNVFHEETLNVAPCEYPGGLPCADRVVITAPGTELFYLNAVGYILELAFVTDGNPANAVRSFITLENQDNTAQIYGRFTVVPEPGTYALMLAGLGLLALARRKKRV